jgi:hypothetical protein
MVWSFVSDTSNASVQRDSLRLASFGDGAIQDLDVGSSSMVTSTWFLLLLEPWVIELIQAAWARGMIDSPHLM